MLFTLRKNLFLYYLTCVLNNHLLKTALNVLFLCYPSGDKNYFNMFGPIYTHWHTPTTASEDRIWKWCLVSTKSLNCSPFPKNFIFGARYSPGSCFICLKVLISVIQWLYEKEILQNSTRVLKIVRRQKRM